MESTKEDYPFLAGNLFNPNESALNVYRVDGLIDRDIEWLQARIQEHCSAMRVGIRIHIERILFAESFSLTIEQVMEQEAESVLEQIHDAEGPNGTHFWFDIEGLDDNDPPSPPVSHSPRDSAPILAR